jgi:hypothetical protein
MSGRCFAKSPVPAEPRLASYNDPPFEILPREEIAPHRPLEERTPKTQILTPNDSLMGGVGVPVDSWYAGHPS